MAGLRLDLGRIDQDLQNQIDDAEDKQEQMDPLGDDSSPEDQLTPMEKLDKYFQSDNLIEREIAVRTIADAAYYVTSYSEFELIIDIACALGSDHEPLIRGGILGTVGPLIEQNTEYREAGEAPFGLENEQRLCEIPVRMLNDFHQQVRRTCHNCIISLLEDARGPTDTLVSLLYPMMNKCLGKEENYDLRMDTATLISRLAPLFGRELCITHFIPVLPSLAMDTMFHVRKGFVLCSKELCSVVGEECTEKEILPQFLQLCKDDVWGVRKACADVFMDISAACSMVTRQDRLTPVFLQLLRDDSRWVRKAAFQALGPFISTFYDPALHNNCSSLNPLSDSQLMDNSLLSDSSSSPEPSESAQVSSSLGAGPSCAAPMPVSTDFVTSTTGITTSSPRTDSKASSRQCSSAGSKRCHGVRGNSGDGCSLPTSSTSPVVTPATAVASHEFGLFQFWRTPLPDIQELEVEDLNCKAAPDGSPVTGTKNGLSPDSDNVSESSASTVADNPTAIVNFVLQTALQKIKAEGSTGLPVGGANNVIRYNLLEQGGGNQQACQGEGAEDEEDEEKEMLTDIKDELLAESESAELERNPHGLAEHPELGAGAKGLTETRALPEDEEEQKGKGNGFPPVRVVIQNAKGQVHEDEVMGVLATRDSHNMSTHRPVSMDMTLVEGVASDSMGCVVPEQEVIPEELIEIYLSMTDPQKAQTIDSDLPFYCAYSFPAVLQTLGGDHWALLKPTFDTLAADMQWKIRRVLACSLHELAGILGQEKTCSELLGVLDEYATKDVDDVKQGLLNHLAEFFEILPSNVRRECLPSILHGLLDTEHEKNWRYRNTLAEQLIIMCELFNWSFVLEHISPVAMSLAHDSVAYIRETASKLIGVILQKMESSHLSSCLELLNQVKSCFSSSSKWILRLLFVKQCQRFIEENRLSRSLFAAECLPTLITLSYDKIPNIRIAVARLLKNHLLEIGYFVDDPSLTSKIEDTLEALQEDSDRDVRYFAGAPVYPSQGFQRLQSVKERSSSDVIDVMVKTDKEGQVEVEGEWDTEEAIPEGAVDGRLIDITESVTLLKS